MAIVLKDRVKVSATTTGTGTFTLGSAAVGFQSFAVIGDTNQTYYTIAMQPGAPTGEFEVGIGTVTDTAGTFTLSRDTVLESSNAGSAVDFPAGTKDVFVTYPAERAIFTDAAGTAIIPATASVLGVVSGGTGITSFGTGIATFLGTPSSANLAAAVTDETGSGALVFATSPTLVTPALGTPSSGNLANCTFPTLNQSTTGNAATATTLQTARTINGTSFNGSANITLSTINTSGNQVRTSGLLELQDSTFANQLRIHRTGGANYSVIQYFSNNVEVGKLGFTGTGQLVARTLSSGTDQLTLSTSGVLSTSGGFSGALSGNATTATRLQTARTIGGVSFNGTANINLRGVNTQGNQNTTGFASRLVSGSNSIQISSNQWIINGTATTPLVVRASGTTRFSFNNTGTAISSLGTLASGGSGGWAVSGSSRTASLLVRRRSGATNAHGMVFLIEEGGLGRAVWANGGILRIGTIAQSGGTAGTVVGAQTSDERLKNIDGPVEYGLKEVMALEPIKYSLKTAPETKKLGFSAQKTLTVIPEVVYDTKEEIVEGEPTRLGMEYVGIIPVLVNAIKEQQTMINELKAEVAQLKGAA